MSTSPLENLELRAAEERQQMHQTATELRTRIQSTTQKLDLRNYVLTHFRRTAILAGFIAFVTGYGIVGLFEKRT